MHAMRRAWARLGAAAAVTILGALLPATAHAGAFPGFNGKLAFSDNDGTDDEIYVVNADGSDQTPLTSNTARDADPGWSPDGSQIAFVSDRDGNNEIYVMNANGTGQTRLTTNTDEDYEPTWSADGTKILFTTDRDGNAEIYAMDPDGSDQTNLTNNAAEDYQAAAAPDGSTIAFVSGRPNIRIHVMDPDGTDQVVLPNGSPSSLIIEFTPTWSPDGTRIAFMSGSGANSSTWDVHVMDADGGGRANLTNDSGIDWYPAWSPDGTRIAFASLGGVGLGLMTMNPDGTGVTTLNGDVAPQFLDWQPISASFSVEDVTVTEGTGGRVDAIFKIRLSRVVPGTVSVDFTTLEGTATSPSDYASRTGTRTFLPGETLKKVTVPIVTDSWGEADETFALRLVDPDPEFVALADDEAIGTILNDDGGALTPSLSITDATVTEGPAGTAVAATFSISLSSASTEAVTVQWSTTDDTATARSDYKPQPPTVVTFDPGITRRVVRVKVYGDGLVEPDETFLVHLSSATNATIADGEGLGTILNDD